MDKGNAERIEELRKKIQILEWDQKMNQLNAGKVGYLTKLKEEFGQLVSEQQK